MLPAHLLRGVLDAKTSLAPRFEKSDPAPHRQIH
jgi:hypothetical protein